MKFIFTGKMMLENIEENKNKQIIKFKSYLKEDFIEKALIIYLDDNLVMKIYFSSNYYGTASWINGRGIYEAHRWEDEDDLINVSTLARRYPMVLEDGYVSQEFAREKIISDVLSSLLDQELALKISFIVKEESSKNEYDWKTILEYNKELTDNFIKDLIKAEKFVPEHTNDKFKPDDKIKNIRKK